MSDDRDRTYCREHCRGFQETGGLCFADGECNEYTKNERHTHMDRLIKFEPKTISAAIAYETLGIIIEARVREKIWQDVSKIVHELIDNPIKGVATRKKIAAAGIISLIYKLKCTPVMDVTPKENAVGIRLDFSFEYFGVRQGYTFININGDRFDVSFLPRTCTEIKFDK